MGLKRLGRSPPHIFQFSSYISISPPGLHLKHNIIKVRFKIVRFLVTFEKITYATSDSIHSYLLVPSITRRTRPTHSIVGARARAAKESNAIGSKQLLMQMRKHSSSIFAG